jgi:hypothetical protein
MWEAPERGRLEGSVDQFTRMVGARDADFQTFLNEAQEAKFCDVTICNTTVTVINRRMLREQKERDNTRLRVRRHRSNAQCNGAVTVPSSSSSSIIKEDTSVSSLSTDGGQPDQPEPSKIDRTPHKQIIALYHEILPELPRIQEGLWSGSTAEKELRARWKASEKRQSLDFWRRMFSYIRGCPWLMGDIAQNNGKPPFMADLRWIVNKTNFTKICEGRYEKK